MHSLFASKLFAFYKVNWFHKLPVRFLDAYAPRAAKTAENDARQALHKPVKETFLLEKC